MDGWLASKCGGKQTFAVRAKDLHKVIKPDMNLMCISVVFIIAPLAPHLVCQLKMSQHLATTFNHRVGFR